MTIRSVANPGVGDTHSACAGMAPSRDGSPDLIPAHDTIDIPEGLLTRRSRISDREGTLSRPHLPGDGRSGLVPGADAELDRLLVPADSWICDGKGTIRGAA